MTTFLLVIQVMIVVLMVGIILMQKTGSDSIAGLSGGGSNLFSHKSSMNLLSKITIFLAMAFILNSLVIAKIINNEHKKSSRLIESIVSDPVVIDRKLEVPQDTE